MTFFYSNTFTLYINGNGGFVGSYLNTTFLKSIIQINQIIFYYILIILIIVLFLISLNFHPIKFYETIKNLLNLLNKKNNKIIQIKAKL